MRTFLVFTVAFLGLSATPQDPPKDLKPWKADPTCRMVFFAVLEGLYTDGVPNEVVDLIVPRDGDAVRKSFVAQCPICHPVLEAFRLYQSRKPFAEDKGDTFGTMEVKKELLANLKSGDVFTRVQAMGQLVQPWIERRLALMRLDAKEIQDWKERLIARANEGADRFRQLKATEGTVYSKEWLFYAGCQACEAIERAVKK